MKRPLLTDTEYKNFVLDHRYGGNGIAVIQDIPDHPEYCRVVSVKQIPKAEIASQAFVAWRPLLSKSLRFHEGKPAEEIKIGTELMAILSPLREQLISGELEVQNTRFVSVKTN